MKLKEYLKGKLTAKELDFAPSSYDVVGDILIFAEINPKLTKKEKLIGESMLKLHRNIKVVCKKSKKYSGKYRTPTLKIIAGEKRKETTYIENGIKLLLDVEKVYFSPRLGTERKRIADLVKKNENVLVMFSGCGPYTIQIAKKAAKVTAIEANPVAHKYALKNITLNKIKNAKILKGDVKKTKLKEKFDRIVMPLPKNAYEYLPNALTAAKKGCIIHLYAFSNDWELNGLKEKLMKICKKEGRTCKNIRIVKAGEYAPHVNRVCFDLKIN